MRGSKKNTVAVSFRKILSVVVMGSCLLFLTSVNYFLYPEQNSGKHKIAMDGSGKNTDNFPPSAPTEEKSSSGGFSILEEILHEPEALLNFEAASSLIVHEGEDAGRILVFHGELISPPPEV